MSGISSTPSLSNRSASPNMPTGHIQQASQPAAINHSKELQNEQSAIKRLFNKITAPHNQIIDAPQVEIKRVVAEAVVNNEKCSYSTFTRKEFSPDCKWVVSCDRRFNLRLARVENEDDFDVIGKIVNNGHITFSPDSMGLARRKNSMSTSRRR